MALATECTFAASPGVKARVSRVAQKNMNYSRKVENLSYKVLFSEAVLSNKTSLA